MVIRTNMYNECRKAFIEGRKVGIVNVYGEGQIIQDTREYSDIEIKEHIFDAYFNSDAAYPVAIIDDMEDIEVWKNVQEALRAADRRRYYKKYGYYPEDWNMEDILKGEF